MHFLLWTKRSYENINFDIFKCSDENLLNSSCDFPNHRSLFLRVLHDSLVSWNIFLCTFLGQTLYQSKCIFFLLFSAQMKLHQILVIFETKNKFLFKSCTTLIVCIGLSTLIPPQKHSSLPQTVQGPRQSPLYIGISWPPRKNQLKIFTLNTISSFKGN